MLIPLIIGIDFLIGFLVGIIVINNNHQEYVWRLLNQEETTDLPAALQSKVLLILLFTVSGVLSLVLYIAARTKFRDEI
jgi:hypothetical protein